MAKVYVVEDDDNIRELVAYALASADFEVCSFVEGDAFFKELEAALPDMVLMDIMLPGTDGISLLKRLRESKRTKEIPVIMLTAKGAEYDRIKGLDAGADDYVSKPFSVMELIARIRAVLRRSATGKKAAETLVVGSVRLQPDKRSVTADGTEIALTYKEFELLYCLMLNKGIVLGRDRILSEIWGYDYAGESRTVDMHIKALRQKLGACGVIIKTVRNVGYKVEEPS